MDIACVEKIDPEIARIIKNEEQRQENGLELIASENNASPAVMAVQGSVLTNKYAEGYPSKRYYGGCIYVDEVEELAMKRARKLFNAEYVNVQPHSGSSANMAVYFAFLKPGDTVLAMSLSHGGHLTHGSNVSFSGKLYNFVHYGLSPKTEMIDLNEVEALAKQHKPKLIIAGASAYSRIIDFKGFSNIAKKTGALLMVDMAHIAGLVAAKIHPSPVPFADFVTSTTHKTLRSARGGFIISSLEHSEKIAKQVFPGMQGGPLMHVIAAKAVGFKQALSSSFVLYQKQIVRNAHILAENLINKGFRLVSGGTDNHLVLIDLSNKSISGKHAEEILGKAGITINKNTIPNEKKGSDITSGIRVGTQLLTSRGMGEEEMIQISEFIHDVIDNPLNIDSVHKKVMDLCKRFPLYKK